MTAAFDHAELLKTTQNALTNDHAAHVKAA